MYIWYGFRFSLQFRRTPRSKLCTAWRVPRRSISPRGQVRQTCTVDTMSSRSDQAPPTSGIYVLLRLCRKLRAAIETIDATHISFLPGSRASAPCLSFFCHQANVKREPCWRKRTNVKNKESPAGNVCSSWGRQQQSSPGFVLFLCMYVVFGRLSGLPTLLSHFHFRFLFLPFGGNCYLGCMYISLLGESPTQQHGKGWVRSRSLLFKFTSSSGRNFPKFDFALPDVFDVFIYCWHRHR